MSRVESSEQIQTINLAQLQMYQDAYDTAQGNNNQKNTDKSMTMDGSVFDKFAISLTGIAEDTIKDMVKKALNGAMYRASLNTDTTKEQTTAVKDTAANQKHKLNRQTIKGISKANLTELQQIIQAAASAFTQLQGQTKEISGQFQEVQGDATEKKAQIDENVQAIASDKQELAQLGVDAPETDFSGLFNNNNNSDQGQGQGGFLSGIGSELGSRLMRGVGSMMMDGAKNLLTSAIGGLGSNGGMGLGMFNLNDMLGSAFDGLKESIGLTGAPQNSNNNNNNNNGKSKTNNTQKNNNVAKAQNNENQKNKTNKNKPQTLAEQSQENENSARVQDLINDINQRSATISNLAPQVAQATSIAQAATAQLDVIDTQNAELKQTVESASAQVDSQNEQQKQQNENLKKEATETQKSSGKGAANSAKNTARSTSTITVGGQQIVVGQAAETCVVTAPEGAYLVKEGGQNVTNGGTNLSKAGPTTVTQTKNTGEATSTVALTELDANQLDQYAATIKSEADGCITTSGEITTSTGELRGQGSELIASLQVDFSSIEGVGSANQRGRKKAA